MTNHDRPALNLNSRKLLIIIISLQLAFLGLIALDNLGLSVPILRQIVAFLYLSFVPGILLLGILKVKKLSNVEIILYAIGLSTSFLMFIGFAINFLFPYFGILKPISEVFLAPTITVIVIFLCVIFYFRGKEFEMEIKISKRLVSPYVLFASLFPLIAILGDYLTYYYDNNILLLILFPMLSTIPILVALNKIPKENFCFVIWMITLSLVLYTSLFGPYMRPTDNMFEYYFCSEVVKTGFHSLVAPYSLVAMLGVTILLPEYTIMCNMDLIWVYKIIVPLFSSLIPVGLYEAFKRVGNDKIAFFSSFFFTSMFVFFTWCSITMKMVSSGLFMMLLILLITNKSLVKRSILGVIFASSLVTSHYGSSYIFMFSIIIAWFILFLFRSYKKSHQQPLLSSNFIAFFTVLTIGWYMYTASGSLFNKVVDIFSHFVKSITTEFVFSAEGYGSHLLFSKFPMYLEILKVFYIISGIFIFLGLAFTYYRKIKDNTMDEYTALSLPFFLFLILPYLPYVGQYGGGRTWYICSFLLAPFCFVGFLEIFKLLGGFFCSEYEISKAIKIIGAFLCLFLLFNSGFTAEVIWRHNISASNHISAPRILNSGSIEEKEYFWRTHISVLDVKSAEWLSKNMQETEKVYGGLNAERPFWINGLTPGSLRNRLSSKNYFFLTSEAEKIDKKSYIYLNEFNLDTGKIKTCTRGLTVWGTFSEHFDIKEISSILNASEKIYTNRRGEIYYYR